MQIVAADDAAGLARQVEDALAPGGRPPRWFQEHRSRGVSAVGLAAAREGRAPFGQIPAQRALGRAGRGHDAFSSSAEHAQEASSKLTASMSSPTASLARSPQP